MINAWSFNRLKTYEECPHRAFLAYVEKIAEPKSVHTQRGIDIHENVEFYLKRQNDELHKDITDDYKGFLTELRATGVAAEEEWAFDHEWNSVGWFDDDCWLRLKVDAIQQPSSDSIILYDWKSGKKHSTANVTNSLQMQLYALCAFAKYPDLTSATTELHYICTKSAPSIKTYTREQANMFRARWEARADTMCQDTDFIPKPNVYNCRFCPFSTNNLKVCSHSVEF